MTQDEIKAEYKRLKDRRAVLAKEEKVLTAEFGLLHARCEHPNLRKTYSWGESGTHCPDCGYST